MKPWLFDILACPIDKFFPLKLYIFSFENEPEEFQSVINKYVDRDIDFIKKERIIETSLKENELFLKDNIIIEKTRLKNYLDVITSSLTEFENVSDSMTPREFQYALLQKIPESASKALDYLVTAFEIADYSTANPPKEVYDKCLSAVELLKGLIVNE